MTGASVATSAKTRASYPRLLIASLAAVAAVVLVAVFFFFVPYHTSSQQVTVVSGGSSYATLTIPQPGWVTVRFGHPGGMSMSYWMNGPSGMMFNHSMMAGGGDSYSFWSWGGTYRCGMSMGPGGFGTTSVWVNASWAML